MYNDNDYKVRFPFRKIIKLSFCPVETIQTKKGKEKGGET